ncbi:MAG: PadR family transcriptional regulator [Lachnospiraceae bacterium]|nr:PadR family transcriptional regulator [Lachnospiraceae bacterium]
MLKHGILGLLNYGDMTGYEIMTVFRDSLSHFWVAQTSQIYRELQTLEKNGWIAVTHIEQDGKPDKNMLSITSAGREELHRWVSNDDIKNPTRSPLLMKTFFRGECGIEENIEFFKSIFEQETVFPHGSDEADVTSEEYKKMIKDPVKALYWKFTIDFGVMYEKMIREWCQHCVEELEDLKLENTSD